MLAEGAVVALRGITLALAPGERVVVHGPNGSGKTTLLRLLAGEQALAAGRAVVAGQAVGEGVGGRGGRTAAVARWRAAKLGWVDQHPARTLRPELDVLGNVALQQRLAGVPATQAREAAQRALDAVGVGELAGRQVETLSGGEAQRVAVAAALAHGPALVLADEPSGELDATNAELVYDALAAAARPPARRSSSSATIGVPRVSPTGWCASNDADDEPMYPGTCRPNQQRSVPPPRTAEGGCPHMA